MSGSGKLSSVPPLCFLRAVWWGKLAGSSRLPAEQPLARAKAGRAKPWGERLARSKPVHLLGL